jgi:uroporphyrinogen decarboxylase
MNSRELMCAAMRRQPTERIPTMPQICHDTPVRIFAAEDGRDWIDGMRLCLEQPSAIYDYVIRLVRRIGADGLRLFVKPEPMRIQRVKDELYALDPQTGARIGRIDLLGGGGLIPDHPEPTIETLDDARTRLAALVQGYGDEKIAILREARQRVPDLFVASSPIGITMNTYAVLRGRVTAMLDFYDRPAFVNSVMLLQAEAAIRSAEKLLGAGIDCFYIGDPSSSGSLISPRHFEQFCMPAYRLFCEHFKNRDILMYMHICGNSRLILEMMADSGVHVVEPLDPLGGVSVADAKARIGSKVALMGGLNTLTLFMGTPADVRAEAIQICREGGPYGYILAAGDMVPPETPIENLQAMVEVATHSLWR